MKSIKGVNPAIICVSAYLRPHYLKHFLPILEKRTRYPHRTIVVLNSPEDFEHPQNREACNILKHLKVTGIISDHIFTRENGGQTGAQDAFLSYCKRNYPLAEYLVFHQDDLEAPEYPSPGPCWLEKMINLIDRNPEYGGIAARIQRTARLDWDECKDDIIPSQKSVPAVLRIHRAEDIWKLGDSPFSSMGIKRWESQVCRALMEKIGLKQGFSARIYVNHQGYIDECKGFLSDEDYASAYSYSPERRNQHDEKPYPEIHPKTLEPIPGQEFKHDREEFDRRNKFWNEEIGLQSPAQFLKKRKLLEWERLRSIVEANPGRWLDIGCGAKKIEGTEGLDMWPYDEVNHVGPADDLWWIGAEEFDGICSAHLLEHLRGGKEALREWDRVLKPGGVLAVIVPDAVANPSTILEPSHKTGYSKEMMRVLLSRFLRYKEVTVENVDGIDPRKASIIAIGKKPKC